MGPVGTLTAATSLDELRRVGEGVRMNQHADFVAGRGPAK
jgi:hypothetical protein